MKRFFVILVAIALLLTISNSAFAALGTRADGPLDVVQVNISSMMPFSMSTDNLWYSIEPGNPNINGYLLSAESSFFLGGQYFENDQTFLSAETLIETATTGTIMSGSYLYDFGLFVGGKLLNMYSTSSIILTPGYRLNIDDKSYIAGTVYLDTASSSSMYYGSDILLKYYADNLFVNGEVFIPNGSSNTAFKVGANYQIMDSLTAGLSYLSAGNSSAYEAGLTWGEESGLLINGKYGQDTGENTYLAASGMFALGEGFAVGAQYDGFTSSSLSFYQVKGEYRADNIKVGLAYISPSGAPTGYFLLTAKMNLE